MKFYDLSKASKYLKTIKKLNILSLIIFIFVLSFSIITTILSNSKIVMIIDIILNSLYFIYLDVYFGLIKKYYLARYHLLAKIDNYEPEFLKTSIIKIKNDEITLNSISFIEVSTDISRNLFIEKEYLDKVTLNSQIELIVVDNIIIGLNDYEK